MTTDLKLSVVINTYNRANSLKRTLESLYYQRDSNFEVVVVNGPSTDNTLDVLKEYEGKIKLIDCPERNLSVSRNLGIEASSGDIVAFIDDDAIADCNWTNDIISAYTDKKVGGVGGLVYDHTGMKLQYKYSACDRMGNTDFTIEPPFGQYCYPHADKFLYLQGTNCSFRKSCLQKIGGFDEEFEYYLDEVDVCMRIMDAGYDIKPVDSAIIHHKYMKSFLRNEEKVVLHPYSTVKNKYYFAVKNNKNISNANQIKKQLDLWADEVRTGGKWNNAHGKMSKEELEVYLKEVDQACKDGLERGNRKPRTRSLKCASPQKFLPFPVVNRTEKPLKICYLSKEYPPTNFGGIGRYTYDLATTFAQKGHEVHVITEGQGQDTVDFEDGVWVHRLVSVLYKPFESMTLGWNFSLQARNYFEVERINEQSPIDIVNGPIWLCETGMVNCSKKYPVVVTLMTTQKILNGLAETPDKESHGYKLMELEQIDLAQHEHIHAISNSIFDKCNDVMQQGVNAFVVPLGCRDLSLSYKRKNNDEQVTIFSVGRLELRKGTDLLLKAAENILADPKYRNVKFVFAGKDTCNTPSGRSYKEEFLKKNANMPEIISNVTFLGEISEEQLMQNYCDADIACTPSRYESFGIVLLEGMSFKNAIVAAKVGGMQDIIRDNESGLFFEADNADDLTVKLKCLLDDVKKREQLAENGRKEYEEKYSLEAVYNNLYLQYSKISNDFSAVDEFDLEKYSEMIAVSENISADAARSAIEDLMKNQSASQLQSILEEDIELSKIMRLVRRCYRVMRRRCPRLMRRLRNCFFKMYMQIQEVGLPKAVYKLVLKIPIIGWIIRYIVDIFKMPLRLEKLEAKIPELLNNDELLKQINNIVSQDTSSIIWEALRENQDVVCEKVETSSAEITNDTIQRYSDKIVEEVNRRVTDSRTEILFELMRQHNEEISSTGESQIQPAIINETRVNEMLKGNVVKLNIGAGHIYFDDYINVDARKINNIDVVADVHNMPFDRESVDEIYASHLIEHFTKDDFMNVLLPYWCSIIKKNGKIRMILPDLESMIQHYVNKEYNIDDLREVLYGLQEYPGDVHYALYGRRELLEILKKCGLEASYTFTDRRNGKCFDMEIVGIK